MMDWQTVLKTVAPWIGTAIGGPLGGMAIEAVANAFGIQEKTVDAVKQAIIGATPEQMLAVKTADQLFAKDMQALGFSHLEKLEQLGNDDRNSARQREISVKDVTPKLLALVVTLGFFGVLAFMLFQAVPVGSRDVLNIMLGSLGTAWVSIIAYYFGSSAGSAEKTQLLAKAEAIK